MYLTCNTCGGLVGRAKDSFEASEVMKEHWAECQPSS